MLYLVWSLLNLGLGVWFVIIAFGVLKLVREHMGLLSTVIFILGVFSLIRGTVVTEKTPVHKMTKSEKFGVHPLKHDMMFELDLHYTYSTDSLHQSKLEASIQKNGLLVGHDWQTIFVEVSKSGKTVTYTATGFVKWKLLGILIYDGASETFTGSVQTN